MSTGAVHLPAPYQDRVDFGSLILRDGSTAVLRRSTADDCAAMKAFFERLSPESRQQRFFSASLPPDQIIQSLCDSTNPTVRLTLVVLRQLEREPRIVAAGSYFALKERTAEVAMAVDSDFQGKGIGAQLLERLSILATNHGFLRFWAITRENNEGMIDVFEHSGFPVRERTEDGFVEIDFALRPNASSVTLSEMRDRVSTVASIRPFFKPKAVAVIGASQKPGSIGYRILDELMRAGFTGAVYPVNPRAGEIHGIRAYARVQDLPDAPDLAILAVPPASILGAVDDCAERGVRALLVITAGFSEVGPDGKELQEALLKKVRGYGMRMVGPNCMGVLNTDPEFRLNASFSPVFPPRGGLAMSSQSGAIGLAVLSLAAERHLGLSTFVSVGNKADVSGNDLLQYWETDDQTRVILLYLESFGNPRRFARIARRVSESKPIVAVKAGRGLAGRRAAGSHTAALAASDAAVNALFEQTGVIRAETLDEMFEIASALGSQPLIAGSRIGIVTNAGGPAILCTDACESGGLAVPELSKETQEKLRSFLPPTASVANPVDMVASAGAPSYTKTIEAVLPSEDIDALVVLYIPLDRNDPAPYIQAIREGISRGRAAGGRDKPVLLCLMSKDLRGSPIRTGGETVPVYTSPEAAARVLGQCWKYAQWKARKRGIVPDLENIHPEAARDEVRAFLSEKGAGWLPYRQTKEILGAFGIPVVASEISTTAAAAGLAAEAIGFPVAVKLASSRIVHKTEAGGVILNLNDRAAVESAFEQIRSRLAGQNMLESMDGVVVQKMISGGTELIVGVADDPVFGPMVGFGLGGIHVEVLKDMCFRIAPLNTVDASSMICGIRGYPLLKGYRGHPPADIEALEDVLLRVSRLAGEIGEIAELDLNPVVALPPGQGCWVLDARIRVR